LPSAGRSILSGGRLLIAADFRDFPPKFTVYARACLGGHVQGHVLLDVSKNPGLGQGMRLNTIKNCRIHMPIRVLVIKHLAVE